MILAAMILPNVLVWLFWVCVFLAMLAFGFRIWRGM